MTAGRVAAYHDLHAGGCFVQPNPWDVGTARALQQLGFKALATTSSGFAWTQGRADKHVALDAALAHFRAIVEAVDIPVNADFEDGFARDPDGVADHVAQAARTGVAGLSVEDSTGDSHEPLLPFGLAVERVRAARAAIDASGTGVLLTARSEGFIAGRPDLGETLRRLSAFAEAGAECLFAPGLRSLDDISAVVREVAPRPVNVIVSTPFATLAELSAIGVRRISVGSGLARVAWSAFLDAAREIAASGTFGALGTTTSTGAAINGLFGSDPR